MIVEAISISLQIVAIYVLVQQGMLLGWLRITVANFLDNKLDKKVSRYVQKPLWDCFTCMSSFWTIVLTLSIDIQLMLMVCGLNSIIGTILMRADEGEVRS